MCNHETAFETYVSDRLVCKFSTTQLLAEERKKNKLLRETLDTRERTIIELQAKINELMKVIVPVSIFYLSVMKSI